MNIIINLSRHIVILFLLIGTGACTKENLAECFPAGTFDISFRFIKNVSGVDKFTTEVNRIDLHVFNAEGLYIKRIVAKGPFAADYQLSVDLPSNSTYTFVAWGEMNDSYEETQNNADGSLSPLALGRSTLDNARLSLVHTDYEVRKHIEVLFHGILPSIRLDGTHQKAQIDLTKNSNVVRTTVRGLRLPAPAPAFAMSRPQSEDEVALVEVQYRGAYGRFRFDNSLAPDAHYGSYIPYTSELSGSTLETEITLPRMLMDHSIDVVVLRNITTRGEELYRENLISLVQDIPELNIRTQDDLDRHDLYEIVLDVGELPDRITIIINGWKIIRTFESLD